MTWRWVSLFISLGWMVIVISQDWAGLAALWGANVGIDVVLLVQTWRDRETA